MALILIAANSCYTDDSDIRKEDNLEPPLFSASSKNPIFTHGSQEAWDSQLVFLPEVVKHQNRFYMFYTATSDLMSVPLSIGLATSEDGETWKSYQNTALLSPGSYDFDAFALGSARILKENDKWTMYFNARSSPGPGPGKFIGKATATNLEGPWNIHPEPVLSAGDAGQWDSGFISPSDIIKVNDFYYLYYSAGTAYVAAFGNEHRHQLGLAISEDGVNFKKYNDPKTSDTALKVSDPVLPVGSPGSYDSGMAWEATVLPTTFGFEMFYTSDPDSFSGERICYATSSNGINWTKHRSNPIFNDKQDWIKFDLVVGSVLRDGDSYSLYYTGISSPFDYSIGVAQGN